MAKASLTISINPFDERRASANLRAATKAIAVEMETALRKKISRPGPPRSKPGQAPRVDSGRLVDTTRVIPQGTNVKVSVQDYGLMLEDGTVNMDRRPWIGPVITDKLDMWKRKTKQFFRELESRTSSRGRRR